MFLKLWFYHRTTKQCSSVQSADLPSYTWVATELPLNCQTQFFPGLPLLGEASKKKKLFFFGKTPKGGRGGLAESKISLSEKTEIFLDFFFKKGGGSHLFQKGVIIKTGDFWIFSPKGEVLHNP